MCRVFNLLHFVHEPKSCLQMEIGKSSRKKSKEMMISLEVISNALQYLNYPTTWFCQLPPTLVQSSDSTQLVKILSSPSFANKSVHKEAGFELEDHPIRILCVCVWCPDDMVKLLTHHSEILREVLIPNQMTTKPMLSLSHMGTEFWWYLDLIGFYLRNLQGELV